jgi:hypothetical protein
MHYTIYDYKESEQEQLKYRQKLEVMMIDDKVSVD